MNLVKMVVLPKFLYLFQHAPVLLLIACLTNKFFSVGQQKSAYWEIRLQLTKDDDDTTDNLHPSWVNMELSLRSLVCSLLPLAATIVTAIPIVLSSLKIWIQMRKSLGFHRASALSPT